MPLVVLGIQLTLPNRRLSFANAPGLVSSMAALRFLWCLNQEPPIDTFLVALYVDHALAGLDKNYRCDDLFQQSAELVEQYCVFVMGDGDE